MHFVFIVWLSQRMNVFSALVSRFKRHFGSNLKAEKGL